mgnify:CR=1 FL=1
MNSKVQLLDCTLRDGAYVVEAKFGTPAIKGIIKRMQDANVDIVECGWLKDTEHVEGTSFFHVPKDIESYIISKDPATTYVAMIDWDRYNLDNLPQYDQKSIDAIRVVFPQKKFREGIELGNVIREKGYKVYLQAANTLGYSDIELIQLAEEVNKLQPVCLSVVDTFGAMYEEDLTHIVSLLDRHLDKNIHLGFHSHNNQQLSFALCMHFVDLLQNTGRGIIIDSSLCGMGRGAGNATTELVANYLNKKHQGNYDMNVIMDAIDTYMGYFQENYSWGYSTPYFISGMYCAHVNNIAYLLRSHRTNAKDMRNIIESLSEAERIKYDYDLLEQKYVDYQNKVVDDEQMLNVLQTELTNRCVLLILPGKSIVEQREKINNYISKYQPVIIGINAINDSYQYDYLFFSNNIRYEYAREIFPDVFQSTSKIITSNVKTVGDEREYVVNFNLLVKRGWEHFDNSGIMCLRLLNKLHVTDVAMAGFDGFENAYAESYADISLPHINPGKKWEELNEEIKDMFFDLKQSTVGHMNISLITNSKFNEE